MNCADLETLLCDYVDGTLSQGDKADAERHLAACASCAGLAQDAAAAVEFMGRAEEVEPPPELITKILYSLPAARNAAAQQPAGIRRFFAHLVQPMLQPRFAMGFAMTILSFSMLFRFAGVSPRQLTREDLNPVKIWQALNDKAYRAWDRSVKFYESIRLVYEIQTRIGDWTQQDNQDQKGQPGAADEQPRAGRQQPQTQQNGGTSAGEARK